MKVRARILILIIIIVILLNFVSVEYLVQDDERKEYERFVVERMIYEQHKYSVQIQSNCEYELILPLILNYITNSSSKEISIIMKNLHMREGEGLFSFVQTEFGNGIKIIGINNLSIESVFKSKYYYDYHTSELHVIKGFPIITKQIFSFQKIWMNNNGDPIGILIQYEHTLTTNGGGSSFTSIIESHDSWTEWKDIEIDSYGTLY